MARRRAPRSIRQARARKVTSSRPRSRTVGQRFTPTAVKTRTRVAKQRSRIRRVGKLSRTRSVDIKFQGGNKFRISAPRNTKPRITIEGRKFVENPKTRPSTITQIRIRSREVKSKSPRMIIDGLTGRVKQKVSNVKDISFGIFPLVRGAGKQTRQAVDQEISDFNVRTRREGTEFEFPSTSKFIDFLGAEIGN
jgi:hypothetical protein